MNQLTIKLENCYGIKHLDETLDFGNEGAFAIYAANGCMKTSLARVFEDLAKGRDSKDLIYPARDPKRDILDEAGNSIDGADILVVKPFESAEMPRSERTSLLLVKPELRQKYEKLHEDVEKAESELLKALKQSSGFRKGIKDEMVVGLSDSNCGFREALRGVKDLIRENGDAPFAEVPYKVLFDEASLRALQSEETAEALAEYIESYNRLLENAKFFGKGFNFYNGGEIAKSLDGHGFLGAEHTLRLKSESIEEVSSKDELLALIEAEKNRIETDQDLKNKFRILEGKLESTKASRDLQECLSEHPDWTCLLADPAKGKRKVWLSYLKKHHEKYDLLIEAYERSEAKRNEIEEAARQEKTAWEEVIELFNDRFIVPFGLVMENRESLILGQERIPILSFRFRDGSENAILSENELSRVLSAGEKRAHYLLNVMFEIQERIKEGRKTLAVMDDIAESFDYRNKYAIVEYMKELVDEYDVKLLILTHNFDFFRTVQSRGIVTYGRLKVANRTQSGIVLEPAEGVKNVFINVWKNNFFTSPLVRVASIPFIRNLIEYTRGSQCTEYITLTSLLHWKSDTTDQLEQKTLDDIYNGLFPGPNGAGSSKDGTKKIVDLIDEQAEACLNSSSGIKLENKVVLSIAIRLEAERYMISQISDHANISSISSNQTHELFKLLRKEGAAANDSVLRLMKRVLLTTSENIHLNSFMYEPILDLSDEHLKKLYQEVRALRGQRSTGV